MLKIRESIENQEEICNEENCLTCSLVDEFSNLIKEDIHWENALRYVLEVALLKEDEYMESLVKGVYGDGFSEGVLYGIKQSQLRLQDYYNDIDDFIEDDLIILDDEVEESVDDIQTIIKKNQK